MTDEFTTDCPYLIELVRNDDIRFNVLAYKFRNVRATILIMGYSLTPLKQLCLIDGGWIEKDIVTNSDLASKQVTLSLTFDTYQGSIMLIKSGKTVQIFCDICAKAPVPTLTKLADVPSDFLPQVGYLSCFTNRGTGQSVPVFIGNDGVFRTTELLGLEANVVYYGAGCYVCK